MLERVDRILMAVRDRKAATGNFTGLLGAVVTRESHSEHLKADRTILSLGESEIELCQPTANGPISRFIERWGEGLYAGGMSATDLGKLHTHLQAEKVRTFVDGDQIFLDPDQTFGAPLVLSQFKPRKPAPGPVNYLYEITNTLKSDWNAAAAFYTRIVGLDPKAVSSLQSHKYGYKGTLTLFNPPERLDRIELSETARHQLRRWAASSPSVATRSTCALSTPTTSPRLPSGWSARTVKWTPRTRGETPERHGLFVHPTALNGLLLGVSRRSLAWEWSAPAGIG